MEMHIKYEYAQLFSNVFEREFPPKEFYHIHINNAICQNYFESRNCQMFLFFII